MEAATVVTTRGGGVTGGPPQAAPDVDPARLLRLLRAVVRAVMALPEAALAAAFVVLPLLLAAAVQPVPYPVWALLATALLWGMARSARRKLRARVYAALLAAAFATLALITVERVDNAASARQAAMAAAKAKKQAAKADKAAAASDSSEVADDQATARAVEASTAAARAFLTAPTARGRDALVLQGSFGVAAAATVLLVCALL